VWNPDLADAHDYDGDWLEVPTNDVFENGFKTQWEEFIRHVVEDAPNPFDFLAGARGVLLAEQGLASSRDGRRIELPEVTLESAEAPAAPALEQRPELTGAL
jgi:predicted dehydrogenase